MCLSEKAVKGRDVFLGGGGGGKPVVWVEFGVGVEIERRVHWA